MEIVHRGDAASATLFDLKLGEAATLGMENRGVLIMVVTGPR
jgi:hypothetical protein